ncbi:hypothetical protein AAHK20_28775 [Trinickia sp. YCB016]
MTLRLTEMRNLTTALLFGLALLLSGCAEMPMNRPQPTVENTIKLRSGPPPAPVEVGSFTLDASKPDSIDRGISIRSNMVRSPVGNSFAQYLRETLRIELQSAGLLNAESDIVITGTLLDSAAEAPVSSPGKATLEARFVVTRQSKVRYDKVLRADATWKSSFIGATAIPQAAGQYEALYRQLVGKLFDDTAFRAAIAQQ